MTLDTSLTNSELFTYLSSQLCNHFPDGGCLHSLQKIVPDALYRLEICINSVKLWPQGKFNHLHSTQYSIFIYLMSRIAYESNFNLDICTKLFLLNKALNGIDIFYEIKLPSKFFIGHSLGIVLSKAHYDEYLVLYQNCTIGKNNGNAPHIGEGTIVFPNAAILGNSITSPFTTISYGARLVDSSTPPNSIIFNNPHGKDPIIKQAPKKYIEDYFRL